ncbi:MAG: hypothetical protein JXR76_03595 [Deltaproteobacteria bacterium]|nr:hypothetical protein [Deltaproteobacteria bacterium]
MDGTPKKDIDAEIRFIEKLHRLGDDRSVEHLSRGLLLSETLTPEQKKRIRKVINGSTLAGKFVTALFVVVALVLFYLYIKYRA